MSLRRFSRFAGAILLGSAAIVGCEAADYGVKVSFQKNAEVHFPDFVLTYTGERCVATERYPRGFLFHDFRVVSSQGTQTVSWSSGTGDIGPVAFEVNGVRFTLELQDAKQLGRLKPAELVIQRVR